MATISLCVIAKNEQDTIACCLESVNKFVKEIIVVDTGSSDDTVSIAQSFGAKIFHYPWADDFAAARNFALDQATGDWIIFLDADEQFEPEKAVNLPSIVTKIHGNRKIDAVCILMKHMERSDGPVIAHTQIVRLFRHSQAIRYQGRIHEAIFKHGRSPWVIYIPDSLLVIHHTGYSQTSLPEKARRNLPLLEKEVEDNHINCLTYYYLSQSHVLLHQYEQAAYYALKAMGNDEMSASTVHYKPYVFYIKSMIFLNAHEDAAVSSIVDTALQKYSFHPEILHCVGAYHHKLGHYSQALDFFQQALAANESYCSHLDNEFLKVTGRVCEEIAIIYDQMNNPVKCFDYTVLALKNEKYLFSAFALLLSQVEKQKPTDILQLLGHIYDVRNKADIDFLVHNLAILNQKYVFAHYLKILSTQFQDNYFIGMKFLICGNFELAFQCFQTLFHNSSPDGAELFAIITSLLNDRPDWLITLYQQTDSPLRKIASAYFNPAEQLSLSVADFSLYATLVQNFIHLGSEDQLFRLLQISSRFPIVDAPLTTLNRLLKQHAYSPVFRFCIDQLQHVGDNAEVTGKFYFQAGFCCYKIRDFSRAIVFFTQALAYTNTRNAATELLTWSYRQCNDPVIRNTIETTQSEYGLELSLII